VVEVVVATHQPPELTVSDPLLASLLALWEAAFGVVLTRPSLANMFVVLTGWVLTEAPTHTITEALLATGVAGRVHHEAHHRLFSRGTWDPDRVGFWLMQRVLKFAGSAAVRVVLDDTVAPKKGPRVFGLGTHVDAVRSTKKYRVFTFGHCWVVLAVLIRVPFSRRAWALPVLFRLYRNVKECQKNGATYRKKTELARDLLDVFCVWVAERRIEVVADAAYCNDTITRGLPRRVVLFGAMRPDAVLTALPDRRKGAGRPRLRGDVLPKPEALAKDPTRPWLTCETHTYGRTATTRYKTICGQWYRACGTGLLRVVVVETTAGSLPFRVFFCTDASVSVRALLETYAERWGIEVFFRDAKQLLGFADSPARKAHAVLRMAPFVGLLYATLVLWFADGACTSPLAAPPIRPWYTHKRDKSFADVLRAARKALRNVNVLDLLNHFGNLTNYSRKCLDPEDPPVNRAA
jgi:DDE superfamily endonuclease